MYQQLKIASYSGSVLTTDADGKQYVVLMVGPCCFSMSQQEASALAEALKTADAEIGTALKAAA